MTTTLTTLTPSPMTRIELLEILNGIRATTVLGQVGVQFAMLNAGLFVANMREAKTFTVYMEDSGRPPYVLDLNVLADLVTQTDARKTMCMNFNLLMKQDMVRTTYEHIAHYCEEHKCFDEMKKQPWWNFARVIRNTISHKNGARLHRWPDNAPDSATWRGHTISKSELGKDIVFEPDEAFRLCDEMRTFAETLPG
jgi:hypothetical protein